MNTTLSQLFSIRLLGCLFSYEIFYFTKSRNYRTVFSGVVCFGVTGGWGKKKIVPGVLSSRQAAISSSLNTNLILILLITFPLALCN